MTASERATDGEDGSPLLRLLLFVAGDEPNSRLARANLSLICREQAPPCRFDLKVVDVFEDYRLALEHKVLVTPCLVWIDAKPPVYIIGTLRDKERLRIALRLPDR